LEQTLVFLNVEQTPEFGANMIGQNLGVPYFCSTRWRIQRSYKIREYFLVMKRLIWEYAFYQELLLRTEAETRALNSKSQKSAIINLQDKQLSVFPIFFVSV
jgi:hypothetical protein